MGKATQDLRKEHDVILHVLEVLNKMVQTDHYDVESRLHYYSEVIYFLKTFSDKCHHGKEENYLFKELVNKGVPNEDGPVGVMLYEHDEARGFIAQMSESVDNKDVDGFNRAAAQYCDLMRAHIEKENGMLFVIADQVISEQEQDLLFKKFEQHEENVVGHGVHEKLHAMIGTWAKAFSVE